MVLWGFTEKFDFRGIHNELKYTGKLPKIKGLRQVCKFNRGYGKKEGKRTHLEQNPFEDEFQKAFSEYNIPLHCFKFCWWMRDMLKPYIASIKHITFIILPWISACETYWKMGHLFSYSNLGWWVGISEWSTKIKNQKLSRCLWLCEGKSVSAKCFRFNAFWKFTKSTKHEIGYKNQLICECMDHILIIMQFLNCKSHTANPHQQKI